MSNSPKIDSLPGYRVNLSPERVEPSMGMPRDISFSPGSVNPGPLVYLTREDSLWLRAYNSVAGAEVEVRGRILLPNGQLFSFSQRITPTSDRVAYDLSLELGLPRDVNGYFLVNLCVVRSAGVFRRGQFFVQLAVFRGAGASGFRHQILASGYVAFDLALGWPGSGICSPLDGPGILRSITGTNPAAGAEIVEVVPTNARWLLRGFVATLTTSATVANRSVHLRVDDGVTGLFDSSPGFAHVASIPRNYNFSARVSPTVGVDNEIYCSIPEDLRLFSGWRISTSTGLLQAGDDWGAPQLLVEEWIED